MARDATSGPSALEGELEAVVPRDRHPRQAESAKRARVCRETTADAKEQRIEEREPERTPLELDDPQARARYEPANLVEIRVPAEAAADESCEQRAVAAPEIRERERAPGGSERVSSDGRR
jgi:hypothetical protein